MAGIALLFVSVFAAGVWDVELSPEPYLTPSDAEAHRPSIQGTFCSSCTAVCSVRSAVCCYVAKRASLAPLPSLGGGCDASFVVRFSASPFEAVHAFCYQITTAHLQYALWLLHQPRCGRCYTACFSPLLQTFGVTCYIVMPSLDGTACCVVLYTALVCASLPVRMLAAMQFRVLGSRTTPKP
jgi:hypothetical protein